MDIKELTQQLISSRLMRTVEEFETFENILYKMLNLKDINHIPNLCSAFDNETECPEVMFNIIHGIEGYVKDLSNIETYLEKIIESISLMLPHAKHSLQNIK